MRYLKYEKTLVVFDGVQLFLGRDGRGRPYICVAVPESDDQEIFLASPSHDDLIEDYLAERIDLRYVVKNSVNGKHYKLSLQSCASRGYPLQELESVPEEWLPERGFFASNHTEHTSSTQTAAQYLKIDIDGRWDVQDLSAFPNWLAETYSFLYSFLDTRPAVIDRLKDIFCRYPWRGGYSAVNFYNTLYQKIPRNMRLSVKSISYASPGAMTISCVPQVASEIENTVNRINSNKKQIRELYRNLYKGMSERELLGRSRREINLDENDDRFVEQTTREFAAILGFVHLEQLRDLTNGDSLSAAKILMSYYRRIEDLANFYDSGKASFTNEAIE